MSLNYYRTLIAVADDCRATRGTVPAAAGGRKTVAVLQYELIAGAPFRLTQEDVLFESWLARQDAPGELSGEERGRLRREFFARPRACLRSSPLPKTYGWGLLFDEPGRVGLCPMESEEYRRLAAGEDPEVKVLKAFRSRRA